MKGNKLFYQTLLGVVLGGFILYLAAMKLNIYGQGTDNAKPVSSYASNTGIGTPRKIVKPTSAVYASAFVKAASENARLQNSLRWDFGGKRQTGWNLYIPLIRKILNTESNEGSPEFARAVSIWQAESNLAPTGVIDRETLAAFIKLWQSQRLNRSSYPASEDLLSAPISVFYDRTRDPGLLQCERQTFSAYKRMIQAAARDLSLGLNVTKSGELAEDENFLRIVSAFRSHEYQAQLRKKEPAAGRAQLAKHSPHSTGHALDLYVGGDPVSTKDANRAIQVRTPVYKWLVKNAHRFGFYPYFYEPWHWEFVPGQKLDH